MFFINALFNFGKTVLLTNDTDDNTIFYTNTNCQIVPGKKSRKMYLAICYELHVSQPGRISGYFIKFREWGQSLSIREWFRHWAKRRSSTARSLTDNLLVFNHHTNGLYKKKGRQLNALKCHHISQDVSTAVFKAFILSNFWLPSNMAPLSIYFIFI